LLSGFTGELSDWILVYVYLAIVVVLKRLTLPVFVARKEALTTSPVQFPMAHPAYNKKQIAGVEA
jgi:hypothetical protein